MRYGLTRAVFGQQPFVDISQVEFEQVRSVNAYLLEALGIEERFNLVLENFAEFESEVLSRALNRMLFADFDWSQFMTEIHTFSRRVANLLSTCRLYLDQVPQSLNRIYGNKSTQAKQFATLTNQEYDANYAYRVMEALRNHVQHNNLPIWNLAHNSSVRENSTSRMVEHTMTPSLQVERLRADSTFKSTVLAEIESTGQQYIDIKPLIRSYIESFGRINNSIREHLAKDLADWDNIVKTFCERLGEHTKGNLVGAAAVAVTSDNVYIEQVYLMEKLTERRKWLEQKNSRAPYYTRHIVAGQLSRDK